MYYNKVEICGVNTSELPVLTDEEKKELLIKSKEGDEKARERLIAGNMRLVLSVIQRFAARGENPDDLFQVGCVGLIKAIDNFDISLDLRLSTYAVPMITGELRRYLRDNNSIRVSRSVRDLAYHALSARDTLSKRMQKEPTIDDITKEIITEGTETTSEEVSAALEAIIEPISLYDPVYSDGSSSETLYVMDQVKDTENTDENWLENIAIAEAIDSLSPRERSIIDKRYYRGKTQMEIAEEMGISQAQVSRLEKGALSRIKKYL